MLRAMMFALAVRGLASTEGQIVEESGVLVLTNDTLPRALESHSELVVEFYAPWCGHCKALEPEYANAAAQLLAEKYSLRLAKIDVTVYRDVGKRYNITSFPTIKLLSAAGERVTDYTGLKTARSIIAWLRRKVGPLVPILTDAAGLEAFKLNHLAVVGFFKVTDSPAVKAFLATAETFNDVAFAITSTDDLLAANGIAGPQGVVLFKQFDEARSEFVGDYTTETLSAYVRQQSVPLVTEFKLEEILEIFDPNAKLLLMFVGKGSAAYRSAVQNATQVALKYRGKIRFVVVDIDSAESALVVALFSLKKEHLPAYRLVIFEGKDLRRYKPETEEMREDLMSIFLARYEAGQLSQDFMSQALPDDWDKRPVKVLVRSNYNDVTRGSGKKVIVLLCSWGIDRCKNAASLWDQLGEKYKDAGDTIVAKFDATANEVEGLKIDVYPTIKFYLPGLEEEIDYSGTRTIDGLSVFVDSDGKQQLPKQVKTASEVTRSAEEKASAAAAAAGSAEAHGGVSPGASGDKSSGRDEL